MVVVVLILGILISAALVALNPIIQLNKAKDAQVVVELGQLKTALDSYYNDHNSYPLSIAFGSEFADNGTVYEKNVPQDTNNPFIYQTNPNNPQWAVIYAKLANPSQNTTNCQLESLNACLPQNYKDSGYNYCIVLGIPDCAYVASLNFPVPISSVPPTALPSTIISNNCPVTISSPGAYILTKDMNCVLPGHSTVDAITINASNATLDCQNHTISGKNVNLWVWGDSDGYQMESAVVVLGNNDVVKNCQIKNADNAVDVGNGTGNNFSNVTVTSSFTGFWVHGTYVFKDTFSGLNIHNISDDGMDVAGTGNVISSSNISNNQWGIQTYPPWLNKAPMIVNKITNNVISNNALAGISIGGGSSYGYNICGNTYTNNNPDHLYSSGMGTPMDNLSFFGIDPTAPCK